MIQSGETAVDVVAGVVWCDGKVLLARRSPGKHLAGYWEFPGGKIEPGETMESALVRELEEEFQVRVSVGELIGSQKFKYAEKKIILHALNASTDYQCDIGDSHDRVAWITPAELRNYEIAPADDFIVEYLLREELR